MRCEWRRTGSESKITHPLHHPLGFPASPTLEARLGNPATTTSPSIPATRTFPPVICLSALKQVSAGTEPRSVGFSYVQGSGDDHELVSICFEWFSFCLDLYLVLKDSRRIFLVTSSKTPFCFPFGAAGTSHMRLMRSVPSQSRGRGR